MLLLNVIEIQSIAVEVLFTCHSKKNTDLTNLIYNLVYSFIYFF